MPLGQCHASPTCPIPVKDSKDRCTPALPCWVTCLKAPSLHRSAAGSPSPTWLWMHLCGFTRFQPIIWISRFCPYLWVMNEWIKRPQRNLATPGNSVFWSNAIILLYICISIYYISHAWNAPIIFMNSSNLVLSTFRRSTSIHQIKGRQRCHPSLSLSLCLSRCFFRNRRQPVTTESIEEHERSSMGLIGP